MSAEIRDVDTWGMPVRFAPRQHESGACWILIEQWSEPTLPILDEGFMGMHLAEGTTWKQAMILAELLNRRVTHLLYTGPDRVAWADNPGFGALAKRRDRDERAIQRLAAIVDDGCQSASARVAAARALLEIGYGRPMKPAHRRNPTEPAEPVVKIGWAQPPGT